MGGRRNSSSFDGKRKTESVIDAEFLESIFDSNGATHSKVAKSRPTTSSRYLDSFFPGKKSVSPESQLEFTLPTITTSTYGNGIAGRGQDVRMAARASSAKVFSAQNQQNLSNQSEVKQRERKKLLQLQQQLTQGPSNNTKATTIYKTDSASDDDFIRNCSASAMSSASSSISWAEDAVEAEFTEKLSSLWDDVDKVCTGKMEEKPEKMSQSVYEECLQWKRAFPLQDLSRFTRYKEKENDSTPTPTSARSRLALELSQAITPLSIATPNFSPPDSRLQDCVTPNPLTSSEYVNSWLSECPNSVGDFVDEEFSAETFISFPSQISTNPVEALATSDYSINSLSTPKVRPNSTSTKRVDRFSPDPNNFFTSLALSDTTNARSSIFTNGNERILFENDENGRKSPGNNGAYAGQVRVQRPISSHVRGHAITPIATGLVPMNSFRKSSANRSNSIPLVSTSSSSLPLLNLTANSSMTAPARTNDLKSYAHSYTNSAVGGRSTRGIGSNYANHVSKFNPGWSRYSGTSNDSGISGVDFELPYFETIAEDFSVESNYPIRPNSLDVPCNSSISTVETSSKNTNGPLLNAQSNTKDRQPAKPFFFWLLDRVSPN